MKVNSQKIDIFIVYIVVTSCGTTSRNDLLLTSVEQEEACIMRCYPRFVHLFLTHWRLEREVVAAVAADVLHAIQKVQHEAEVFSSHFAVFLLFPWNWRMASPSILQSS